MNKNNSPSASISPTGAVRLGHPKGEYWDQIFGPSPHLINGCRNGPALIDTEYEDHKWWAWPQRIYGPERIWANGHEGFERLTLENE